MNFRGAIFDLDGVLVDTVPVHFWAWKTMFENHGIAFDSHLYLEKVDGRTRIDGVRAMMPHASERSITKAADQKQALFVDRLTDGLKVFESSIRLVNRLSEAGIQMAVASSSANIRSILSQVGILDRFGSTVSGSEIANGKPHPEIFLTAADQLGLSVAECVVFEDATSGVQAAKSGGFYCVGIDRNEQPDRLAGADVLVSDLGELDAATLFALIDS